MQWNVFPPLVGEPANPAGVHSLVNVGLMMEESFGLPEPMALPSARTAASSQAGGASPTGSAAVISGMLAPFRDQEQVPSLAALVPRPPLSELNMKMLNCGGPISTRKRSNSFVDEDIESMDVIGMPYGLRTPQNAAHSAEDRASTIKVPRTPQRPKEKAPLSFFSPVQATPEAKKCISATPPSGPALLQKRLEDDIDAALDWHSLPLLSLALSRGHCCGQDHVIFEAVRRQNVRALRFLLESGNQEVDQRCGGRRPLQLALQACMVAGDTGYKMAELLLQHGASPNAMTHLASSPEESGCDSPLHDAMQRGCFAGVELLLRFGSDANAGDKDGITPMHHFARHTLLQESNLLNKALSCLLLHGACPFAVDRYGNGPLDYTHDQANRQVLVRAQRWWSRRSVMQVCRLSGECDGTLKSFIPWALPEIFEVIVKFLSS